jgi:methenyltetrahydrofolate cyclohydrolase
VAEATPAPGGGSSSAVTCALAAGLVEMAAGFGGDELRDSGRRAAELRERALVLAARDLTSYEPVLAALRLPSSDPERDRRIARASADAAQVPLEIAELGAELAQLAERSVSRGSRHLEGDATTAALLAEAGCRAAVRLVEINLDGTDQDEWRQRAHRLAGEATSARERALATRSGNGA